MAKSFMIRMMYNFYKKIHKQLSCNALMGFQSLLFGNVNHYIIIFTNPQLYIFGFWKILFEWILIFSKIGPPYLVNIQVVRIRMSSMTTFVLL